MMRIEDLEKKLVEIGVPEDLYSIMIGGLPNEKLCLSKKENGIWEIYYSERGRKSGLKTFKDESDACDYFYAKLERYKTNV